LQVFPSDLDPKAESSRQSSEPFQPKLRLFAQRMLVESLEGKWREQDVCVLALRFDYDGMEVRPRRDEDDLDDDFELSSVERDDRAESQVQALIERNGAVELDHIEGLVAPHDTPADYALSVDGNMHAICSFASFATGELSKLGWAVEVDATFPYRLVGGEKWVAELKGRGTAWFDLEIGVDVDGERVDLAPALIKLLADSKGESWTSLSRHAARCRALPVGDGRFVVIPWTRLSPILTVLSELYSGRGSRIEIHEANLACIGRLEATLAEQKTELEWRGAREHVDRGRKLADAPSKVRKPATLKAELRSYQQQGLEWLCHLREHDVGGVLADDMGLGKTIQTIALLSLEKEARRMDRPTLIVVPTSLVEVWRRQLEKFAPHLRVIVLHGKRRKEAFSKLSGIEIAITTYALVSRDLGRFKKHAYHYLILDEAQAIKNPRSQASKSVRALKARHRLGLSGTPVENNLDELWSLFDFVMPGLLGTAERFRQGFRHPIERDGDESRLAALRSRVAPLVLRRTKENVAKELPPKTELVRYVELGAEQRDLYETIRVAAHTEVRTAIKQRGFGASGITILDALMKLRQVCCSPRIVPVDAARAVEHSAKEEAFFSLLESELGAGRRVLVFSQFARMLALLSKGLEERGIRHAVLDGSTRDRQKLVDAFQGGELETFLISLKAGGTGLTLTRAETVIHYDPWWNAAAQMQATDRAHRIGQTRPVFVHNLVVSGSVEERMLALQQRKRNLAETLIGSTIDAPRLLPHDVESLLAPLDELGD
jgi:superfamily II DNA or RNA helicase